MKSKQVKRLEAEARQAEAAKRTPGQQLARLDAHGWRAARERARLQARLHQERVA